MVNHFNKSPRQWTKRAWIDLKDTPTDEDLGYRATELAVSRKPDNGAMIYNPDSTSSGKAWLCIKPESAFVDQVANYR